MKKKQNNSLCTFSVTLISLSAVLLTLAAAPARNRIEQKPAGAGMALQSAHHGAVVSESSAAPKPINTRKSQRIEFSASRQSVIGREIAGFSARQAQTAQQENLTPPAGLKPVEQEAWLAMARRQGASGGMELASFYPARYGEPFVVEGEGVRVAVRPVGGTDVAAQVDTGQVIYRQAYPETDSVHAVSSGRSEEFLYLQSECAPREFAYELSEVSSGTQVKLVNGEVRFTNKSGQGVKIEAPWLIEANGARRADAVRWKLDPVQRGSGPQRLRLVVAAGLRYPVVIDPSWTTTGGLSIARNLHTATLLSSGKVLVAAGRDLFNNSLTSAELYDPASGTWTATGSLITARYEHTATLLPSGKVLVTGGLNFNGVTTSTLSSAELYDPTTGTWSATANLATARQYHTATLLANGKVLVAGGKTAFFSPALSSAELYDPVAATWTATIGPLVHARAAHTATLLPNGNVLLAAGGNNDVGLTSAELYNPASGMWTATGSLAAARTYHSATLLPTGKVLVAGGTPTEHTTGGASLSSAELYDPMMGSWSSTGSMGNARNSHTATLLPSGKVLVAAGANMQIVTSSAELFDPTTGTWSATANLGTARLDHTATLLPSGKVLVAAGAPNTGSSELYDPAAGSWSNTGSLATARFWHTATLLPNGKVLVAGGAGDSDLTSAELYDPASGTWSATGSLNAARFLHTATLLPNGKVLVAGGVGESGNLDILSSAELYDPAANGGAGAWSATSSLSTARISHTATLLPNGKVLVAGGQNNSGDLTSAELYDPASGSWSVTGSLNSARTDHTATLLPNGKVLVAGGFNGDDLTSAELYDPASGSWSVTGSLNTARDSHTATLLANGKALVAGGAFEFDSPFSSAELYDPASGTWSATGSLHTARTNHTATLLPNGKVLVAGGFATGADILNSAELYDPASGTWMATGSMLNNREYHTATLLPNGKVLVAGGSILTSDFLSSAELYDQGLGFDPSWQPLLTTVSPLMLPNGSALTASGSRFEGISEASGGNGVQNSSSNYPLVQLLSLANEQTLFLPVDAITGWSDTSFTSTPITLMTTSSSGFPIGYALVTVFTNGIPSQSQFVLAEGPSPTPSPAATNLTVTAASDTYGGMVTLSATLTSNSSPVSGKTISFILNGNPAGSGVTDNNGVATSNTAVTLCGSSYNVSGSPYASGAAASFSGDTDYAAASGSNSLSVGKATATVIVNAYTVPYDGNPHTATVGSVTGVCGETGDTVGTVNLTGTTHTLASGSPYTDTWSFTGGTNYNDIPAGPSTTITDTINRATPTATIAVSNSPQTYNGSPRSATVVVSMSSVPGTVANVKYNGSSTAPTNAAAYTVTADFVPTDTNNYNALPGLSAGSFVIQKATPTINWSNPADITYGTALSGTQLNAAATLNSNSVPGTFTYTPPATTVPNAGNNQVLSVDFTPTDTTDFNSVNGTTVDINVLKATPTVNWSNPADIVAGTALSGTQLDATFTWVVNGSTVTVAGTATYTPPSGTVLPTGAGQDLNVAFIPTNTTNYNNASGDVTINVGYGTCTGPNGPGHQILQPINADGSSVFKVGRTVPVKFTVCDASGNPISDPMTVFGNSTGSITLLSAVRGTINGVNETGTNDIPDVAFRYSDGIWIFNMATSNMQAPATYTFQINLASGSIQFQFGTK